MGLLTLRTEISLLLMLASMAHAGTIVAQTLNGNLAATASLKQLSVEELMNVEVTSVSKTAEPLGGAAAAVAVVSNEDIARSGALDLPDALRWTPGINVAQETADTWAVSSRGFSSINSEKLLVLSDTRSIYTPLYSGVFWDVQDYLLQDIDRVEVIRGPGAALWGSNAVNGVINISTKSAKDTQGGYLEAEAGTEQRAEAAARYGGRTDNGIYYRVFGKYSDHDESFNSKTDTSDAWHLAHGGFRADWDATGADALTLQGDVYSGEMGRLQPSVSIIGRQGPQGRLQVDVSGGNVLARWRRTFSPDADLQLRVYYDHTHRNDPSFLDDLDTIDLDLQHHFKFATAHDVLWGVNYRHTVNRNEGKVIFAVDPPTSRDQLFSGFVQDQIAILKSLHVTLGSKLEHNDFSGTEVQPSARAAWDFLPEQTLWAAVSRAVRMPTRLERDLNIEITNPGSNPDIRWIGNKEFDSEKLLAYELGYRWQASKILSLDLATFLNRYRGLASLEAGTPYIDPNDGRTVIPLISKNLTDGRSQGVEALVNFAPLSFWRLTANYSYLDLDLDAHGLDLNRGRFTAGATPRHQLGLRSFLDLPRNVRVDAQLRYLSAIRQLPELVNGGGVPGYTEMDLRLAWQALERLELSLVGQNLLHAHHPEFGAPAARGEIERSVYAKASWGY